MTEGNSNIDKEIDEIIHKNDHRDDVPSVLKSSRPVYRKYSTRPIWIRLKKPLQMTAGLLAFFVLFFPMRHTVVISGKVIARETVTLDARVGGVVLAVETANGATVRKGDTLVRIENTSMAQEESRLIAQANILREEIKGLTEELAGEKERFEMQKQLLDTGEISRLVFSVHETNLRKAERRLNVKKAELVEKNIRLQHTKQNQEFGTVVSPIDGVVTSPINRILNTTVREGDPLCEIAAGGWQFEFDVKEDVLSSVEKGSVFLVRVSAFPSQSFPARVEEIRPVVYEDRPQPWLKSNNARIILSTTTPLPEELRLGMTVKSNLLSKTRRVRVWRWWSDWRSRMA